MKLPKLDHRLITALDFVRPDAVVADIGTDHAYLPVYLTATGRARRAIACDIVDGPLARAREHIAAYGMADRVSTVKTDGLCGLADAHPTDIIIFGMGGELIARILADAPWIRDTAIRLILQPMTHAEEVRRFLAGAGFLTVGEVLSRQGNKIYQTIAADYDGKVREIDELTALAGWFCHPADTAEKEALRVAFLQHKIQVLQAAVEGKRLAGADCTKETEMIAGLGGCL